MPRYCLDTSGLSNPLETFPPDVSDIFSTLWAHVIDCIRSNMFCCTNEIFDEIKKVEGEVGDCLRENKDILVFEIGAGHWPWDSYIQALSHIRVTYNSFISEYNGGRRRTMGLNHVSIVALAQVLGLPVLSMEKRVRQRSVLNMRIPDLCDALEVKHLNFNEWLKAERIGL